MKQINGIRVERLDLIKYEVIEILEENNVPDAAIGQVVRLMAQLKILAANQKADYLSDVRRKEQSQ